MGNCLLGGTGENDHDIVQVITSNNGIMEFISPITVERITDEFPGHGVFRSHDLFWKPIPQNEVLVGGASCYLLPLDKINKHQLRSNSVPLVAPYRMSFDSHGVFKRSHTTPGHKSNFKSEFWKVKLVISPQQLMEILRQESRTQELIENVRTVAKCGLDVGFSDQWSFSSNKDFILEI